MTQFSIAGGGAALLLAGLAWLVAGVLSPDVPLSIGPVLLTVGFVLMGFGSNTEDNSTDEDPQEVPLGPDEVEEEYEQ